MSPLSRARREFLQDRIGGRFKSSAEQGSAYIVALLVLVVLTLVGLSLALITQTELEIGSTERTLQRVFYAADSGIAASTAKVLTEADNRPQVYRMEEREQGQRLSAGYRNDVQVSLFAPIIDPPCNLCQINDAGTYNDDSYKKVTFEVSSTGRRRQDVPSGQEPLLAEKELETNVEIQPFDLSTLLQWETFLEQQGNSGDFFGP